MTTQTQNETKRQPAEISVPESSASMILGFAVIGLLVAGGVGVVRALSMETGSGVLLCLLGSVAAFGLVVHICLRRD
jgi:hypothetical protein